MNRPPAETGASSSMAMPLTSIEHALVLANPIAGRGQGPALGARVVAGLARRGVHAELCVTASAHDDRLVMRRRAATTDVVIAVGGDGTIRDVLEGLPGASVPIGIVPAGTANVLARDLGIPRDVDAALDVIIGRRTVELDVARANDRLCFLAASVGFDALVVEELARRRRGAISPLAYLEATARVLRHYRPPRLVVELDGEVLPEPCGLVIIGNARTYAMLFGLCPDRRLDDGCFEVFLFPEAGLGQLALAAVRSLRRLGGSLQDRGCPVRRARRVTVASSTPVPCQIDGDPAGCTPFALTVQPGRYRVIVP